jgi:hypothetical protein
MNGSSPPNPVRRVRSTSRVHFHRPGKRATGQGPERVMGCLFQKFKHAQIVRLPHFPATDGLEFRAGLLPGPDPGFH